MDKEDVVHIYNAATKMNERVPSAQMGTDLETVIHNEVSQKEKNRYHMILLICGSQKNNTDELTCKVAIETQMQKTYLWTLSRAKNEWDDLGDWY